MAKSQAAPVIIAGGGPVGLTLAMDLAWRGIEVIVVERRAEAEPPPVKCNHISARSMEIFRRLGVAESLRNAGLPPDYPHDVAYRTTMTGRPITRIQIPSRAGRRRGDPGPDTTWPTTEPPHRINQCFMEPILFAHAAAMPNITILNRTSVTGFIQSPTGVTITAENLDTAAPITLCAQYLIGADGARSTIRRALNIALEGDAVVQRVQSSLIRAPSLLALMADTPSWASFSLNPRRTGNVYAIDGTERWLVHNYLRDDEPDFESVDRDWAIRTILGTPPSFQYDLLSKEDWFGRRLIATSFRRGRVFLCGDAAHIWVPYAGYGMNAGIADAANLAWLLAAHLQGWAGENILNAYEAERLPITEQVSRFAMNHAIAMASQRRAVPPEIESEGPEADTIRAAYGQQVYNLNVQQYAAAGLNFGYYYENSPIIAPDPEPPPPYTMGSFTPSTVPGCRLPHQFLANGASLYDALGPNYTLLRANPALNITPLLNAPLPLTVLDVPLENHPLLLVRPDQHIAWRGHTLPPDVPALVDRVTGR